MTTRKPPHPEDAMRGSPVLAVVVFLLAIVTVFHVMTGPAWLAALAGVVCGWSAGLYYCTWLDDEMNERTP